MTSTKDAQRNQRLDLARFPSPSTEAITTGIASVPNIHPSKAALMDVPSMGTTLTTYRVTKGNLSKNPRPPLDRNRFRRFGRGCSFEGMNVSTIATGIYT